MSSLKRLALSLTRARPDAEDLLQQTYLDALRDFGELRDLANCGAWMRAIMRRRWVKQRTSARQRPALMSLEDFDDAEMDRLSGRDEATMHQVSADVRRVLAELPEAYRQAVFLVDGEGLGYADVARRLSVPIGTVRSRLSRGREMIAERVDGARDK